MSPESKPELKIVAGAGALYQAAAGEFLRCAQEAIKSRGRFCVALSGGNTPRGVYSLLAATAKNVLAWDHVYVFFGDERCVPPDHSDSNYRMANETLLSKIPIPAENVFRVRAELDAAEAARQYNGQLRDFFCVEEGAWPRFDLVFLGLGDDGHTASLFPGSAALKQSSRLVVANWVEKFKSYRITFTYPVLNHAREVAVLVSGEGKASILRDVLKPSEKPVYPAQGVRPDDGRLLWMADETAASLL